MISDRAEYIEKDSLQLSTKNKVERDYPRPILTSAKFRGSLVPRESSSRANMAPMLVNFTLPATVLITVVIPGIRDFNIADPTSSVTELPNQSQLAVLPDGYVAHPDIGVAYKVHDEQLKWTSARRRCISEGAHLAVIDTTLKFNLLMTQLKSERTWTDIHKMQKDTEWVSSDTELPMTTLPWASQEPSGDNYCVAASKSPRGLRNFWCINEYSYTCEIPIPKNYNARGITGLPEFYINNPIMNSTPTPAPAPSTLPEGYVRFSDLHSAYKLYTTAVTWVRARDQCIEDGAHLAITDTVEKIERIYAMKSEVYWKLTSVGIRKSLTSDDWLRVDNDLPLTSIPWASGNPDDLDGCAFIEADGKSLTNLFCETLPHWYVCEISI